MFLITVGTSILEYLNSLHLKYSLILFNKNVILFSRKSSCALLYLFLSILYFFVAICNGILFQLAIDAEIGNYFCILIMYLATLLNN